MSKKIILKDHTGVMGEKFEINFVVGQTQNLII